MECIPVIQEDRVGHRPLRCQTVEITKTFLSELVDVRSFGVLASVATDPFDAVVLAGNPENIGLGHLAVKAKAERAEIKIK